MRLICFWCCLLAGVVRGQDFYAPQTFKQNVAEPAMFQPMHLPWNAVTDKGYQKGLFTSARSDVIPQGTSENWRSGPQESWKGSSQSQPKPEPWRSPYSMNKEQQAAILHHKQALTSDGNFRFEYASDNGLAAGEVIEPDGSRVGGYQYKDPHGQLVKLKYRAGKDGFQIIEGSHLPKSPEPVQPAIPDNHYQHAYAMQREQYKLQQQYNQQEPQQSWREDQGYQGAERSTNTQYYAPNWRSEGGDDGQYHPNEVEEKGPHSFGGGYAFQFKG